MAACGVGGPRRRGRTDDKGSDRARTRCYRARTSGVLPKRAFTLAEHLAIESEGNVRHEFVGGELVAMTGTSRAHDTIATNLAAAIRPGLRGTPCRIASADVKVVIAAGSRGYYPDVVVCCGRLSSSTLLAR